MLRAIIFDVDGTLAETEEVHRQAFNETFAHFMLPWHWTEACYRDLLRVTGGKERIRRYLTDVAISPDAFPDIRIAELHAFKTSRYVALLSAGSFELRPGIRDLIQSARQRNIRLAIATTTSRENVVCLLEGAFGPAGVELFSAIVCGNDVARKKPAPDVYLHVLEKLAVDPSDCVAIEDSRNGLLSAHSAGIRVAVTPAFYTRDEDFSTANWMFDRDKPTLDALIASLPLG